MNQFKVIFLLFIFIKLGLDGFDVIYSIIKSVGNSSISDSFGLKNYYTYYRNSLIVKEFTINNLLSRAATHTLAICIHVIIYFILFYFILFNLYFILNILQFILFYFILFFFVFILFYTIDIFVLK